MMKSPLISLLLLFVPLSLGAEPVDATIIALKGTVVVAPPGDTPVQATVGMKVPVGSTITTADNSEVELKGLPQTTIKLSASAELVVTTLDLTNGTKQKTLLDLKNGSLNAAIKNLDPSNTDFRVKTPLGVAAARGTVFRVIVADHGKSVRIIMAEGKVGVEGSPGHSGVIEVSKGQMIIFTFTNADGVKFVILQATYDELVEAGDLGIAFPAGFTLPLDGGGGGVSAEVTPIKNK